ncbi:hypothetical protein ACH4FX_39975 [Streptomyces sp. NPDC018019]|uniref:hypothetical protein n=1 Tax=Streptomyces sp. NPDC018019 TaxID=3365030 RepID=UPI0037ABFBB9
MTTAGTTSDVEKPSLGDRLPFHSLVGLVSPFRGRGRVGRGKAAVNRSSMEGNGMPKRHSRPLFFGFIAATVMAAGGTFATPAVAVPKVSVQVSGSSVTITTPYRARGCSGGTAGYKLKAHQQQGKSSTMERRGKRLTATFTGLKPGAYKAQVWCDGAKPSEPGVRDFTIGG